MKSHIIGFLLVTLAQTPMPIKIGTTFQNKLRPIVKLRERERHRVDQGKKRKKNYGGWWMVDGGYPFPDALH